MDEFRKPEETEIDLMDLIFYCLKKWRLIVVCMLTVGILCGGYKFMDTVSENAAGAAAEAADEEDSEDGEVSYSEDDLIEIQDNVLTYYAEAIEVKEAYMDELTEYMETSVLMNLDSYNVDTASVSYYVDAGDADTVSVLAAAYETFVTDGSLGQALLEADESIPETDLNYLISFDSSDVTLDINEDDTYDLTVGGSESIFAVSVAAADEDAALAYAEVIQDAMSEYAAQLSGTIGEHTLTLISVSVSEQIDTDIQEYQSDILTKYSTVVSEMQALRYYYGTAIDAMDTEELGSDGGYVYQNSFKKGIKYGILGLVLGACLAIVVLALVYLLGGRLQSLNGFKETYGLVILGRISKVSEKKRLFGFIDRLIVRLRDGAYSTITCEEQLKIAAANIRTAAKNEGVQRIMVAGTLCAQDAQVLYERLAAELSDLKLSAYSRIVFSAGALEELDGYDGIVFLEQQGVSYTRLIDEERALAADRKIHILGAVVA